MSGYPMWRRRQASGARVGLGAAIALWAGGVLAWWWLR